jgi:hypothetical protein
VQADANVADQLIRTFDFTDDIPGSTVQRI